MSRRRSLAAAPTLSVQRARLRRRAVDMPKIVIMDREERWDPNNVDEYLWWPRVHWIDPGTVSGVATVWFDPQALLVDLKPTAKVVLAYSEMFLHGPENGPNGQVDTFLKLRDKLDAEIGLATGCESFVPRMMSQDVDFLSPVRIRAGLDYAMSMITQGSSVRNGEGVQLFTQSPSDALNSFTNERLKALQMYREGPDHVNDAKRHCLLWIRKLKGAGRGMEFFKQVHGYEEGWFS